MSFSPANITALIVAASFSAGLNIYATVLTLGILEFRKRSLPPALARQPWVVRLHEPAGGVPYGIALAAAALLVYPSTVWMQAGG